MAAIPQLALGTVAGGDEAASHSVNAAVDMSDVHGVRSGRAGAEDDGRDCGSRAATVGKSALPSESGDVGGKRDGRGGWAGQGRGGGAWDTSQRQALDTSTASLMTQEPEDRGPGFAEQDTIRTRALAGRSRGGRLGRRSLPASVGVAADPTRMAAEWVPWSDFMAEQEAKGAPPARLSGIFLANALEEAVRQGTAGDLALAPEDALRARGLIVDAHAMELEQKLPQQQAAAAAASLRRARPSPSSKVGLDSRASLGAGRLNRGLVQRLERIRMRVEESPPEVASDAVDAFVADLDTDYDELVGLGDVERFTRRAGVALPRSLLKAAVVEAFLNRRDGATLRGLPSTPMPPPPHVAASYTLLSSVSSTKAHSKRAAGDRQRLGPTAKLAGGLSARERGPRLPLHVDDFADALTPGAAAPDGCTGPGMGGNASEALLEAARTRRRERREEEGAARGVPDAVKRGSGGALVLTMPDMKVRAHGTPRSPFPLSVLPWPGSPHSHVHALPALSSAAKTFWARVRADP